jgi:hypothetical protein
MYIGYAEFQLMNKSNLPCDALQQPDCEQIFTDQVSSTKARRPDLEQALSPFAVMISQLSEGLIGLAELCDI